MERIRIQHGEHQIWLLGACQGLEGEARAVDEAVDRLEPSTVALALDPEVTTHIDELAPDPQLGAEDDAWEHGLSRWGEVELPPPEFQAALEAARRVDARVEGVDMPEEEYLDRFTTTIGVLDLAKRAFRVRWLKTRPPKAEDPATFCRRFDERVNKGPFRELEDLREQRIAQGLLDLVHEGSVACLLEVQRLEGVRAKLEAPQASAQA